MRTSRPAPHLSGFSECGAGSLGPRPCSPGLEQLLVGALVLFFTGGAWLWRQGLRALACRKVVCSRMGGARGRPGAPGEQPVPRGQDFWGLPHLGL